MGGFGLGLGMTGEAGPTTYPPPTTERKKNQYSIAAVLRCTSRVERGLDGQNEKESDRNGEKTRKRETGRVAQGSARAS